MDWKKKIQIKKNSIIESYNRLTANEHTGEQLFLLGLAAYLAISMWATTMFPLTALVSKIFKLSFLALVGLKILLYDHYHMKPLVAMALAGACMVLALYFSSYAIILVCLVMVAGSKDVSFEKILQTYLLIIGGIMLLAFVASLLGVIENLQYETTSRGIRNSFGIVYTTDFAAHVFYLILTFFYLKGENLRYYHYILTLGICGLVYYFCNARLDSASIALVVLLFALGNGVLHAKHMGRRLKILWTRLWEQAGPLVVPAMAAGMLSRAKEQKEGKFFGGLMKFYEKILRLSLRFKPIVLLLVIVLLIVSMKASFAKGTAFMPDMDSTQISMTLTLPKDTPLAETAEVTDRVVEKLMEMDEVVDVGAMASTSNMGMLTGGGNSSTNVTSLYISLREDKERDNLEIARDIEINIADILETAQAEAAIETSTMDMSALGGSGITVQIKGRELDTLQEIARDVAAIVESVEGTVDVSDGLEESTGELRIIIDRNKAIEHGLTVAQIFQQIQAKLADATSATTLETEIEEYDVYVKNAKDLELTRNLVKDLEIERSKQDGTKDKIKLSDIAVFESTQAPKSVNRVEQSRYIGVTASVADGYNIGFVSGDVEKALQNYEMPSGYSFTMSGENETINEAMKQVYLMLLLALIFMYLIMVAQFQSLLSPFIIMFTIPLAFTGGFMGLVISGSEVSVIAMIGFVMLSGIIVNNGIVIVDYMNQLRAEGMEKKEAIVTAGKTRIRPVMMTALTTILALSTMAFSDDMGADMSKPMSVVTIGGLIYGTLLTLIVIPCIYDIFTRDRKKKEDLEN